MKRFVITLIAFLLTGFSYVAVAQQSSLKFITEFPLHFGIAYEGQVSKHFSVGTSIGVMASPNSDLIIAYLEFIGTDKQLVILLDDAFQLGIVGEVNVNYNFKRNYIGVFSQIIGVKAGDASAAAVEGYFGVNIEDQPLKSGGDPSDRKLQFKTRLYQAGLLYGHRFPLKNKRLEIDAEMGLSFNIGSKSTLYNENRDFTELNDKCNDALDEFYKAYDFIPSLSVMFVYKLKKQD